MDGGVAGAQLDRGRHLAVFGEARIPLERVAAGDGLLASERRQPMTAVHEAHRAHLRPRRHEREPTTSAPSRSSGRKGRS